MNNEEKILTLLEALTADVKDLKQGQAKLEAGQSQIKADVADLRQFQANTEVWQKRTDEMLDTLIVNTGKLIMKTDSLEADIAEIQDDTVELKINAADTNRHIVVIESRHDLRLKRLEANKKTS